MSEPAASILRSLRAQRAEMVELLRRLAEAESPSLVAGSMQALFELLAPELLDAGYRVRRVPGHGVGDHLCAVPAERLRRGPYQLLVGHMDTVWPIGTLAQMPVREEGGLLYGPGVADMKGGLVEAVFALRVLRELELTPSVAPIVFFNSDEEVGSVDSTRWIRLLARGAERAFVLESGEGPDGRLKIARKGTGKFTVRVRGRPAHAGADPEHGISAILELSHQIQRLHALNDRTRGVTVNVGTIDGGLRPNVVAPEASAVVDVRAPTLALARDLEREIRSLEPVLPGARLEIDGGFGGRLPMEPLPRNRALLATAVRLGRELELAVGDAGLVGGASDANTTSVVTATLDGLGPVAEGSHAQDERLDTGLLPDRTALLALLLLQPVTREIRTARRRRGDRFRPQRGTARVAVVGTDASTTNPELVEAWRALGIDAALVGAAAAAERFRPGDIALGRLDILPSIDGVEPGLLELLRLERRGFHVLNPAFALAAAHDQLLTARWLIRAGVPHPQSERLLPSRELRSVRPPCVVKPRFGSWGADVVRCDTDEELQRCLEELDERPWFLRRGALVQELVPPAGSDLRLLVAGGDVIGAIRRVAPPGEWRTNVSLGATREHVEPDAAARNLALAAAQVIGADLVGVDILSASEGYVVIELDGAVDFNSAYALAGGDVYAEAALSLGLLPGRRDANPARLRPQARAR